jgi:hypothetical protein
LHLSDLPDSFLISFCRKRPMRNSIHIAGAPLHGISEFNSFKAAFHGKKPWPGLTGRARSGRKNAMRSNLPYCTTAVGHGRHAANPIGISPLFLTDAGNKPDLFISIRTGNMRMASSGNTFKYFRKMDLLSRLSAQLTID